MDTRKKARKKGGFPLFPIEMLSCCMCVEGFSLFSSSGDGSLAARKKRKKIFAVWSTHLFGPVSIFFCSPFFLKNWFPRFFSM